MQVITAPIVRVVVVEDRAFVRRHTQLALEPGRSRWLLAGLTPVLVDKSLTVLPGGAAQLVSTQVQRKSTAPALMVPAEREAAPPDPLARELLQDELRAADAMYQELLMIVAKQSAWGLALPEEWESQLAEIMRWKDELEERQLGLLPEPSRPRPPVSRSKPVRSADVMVELESADGGEIELTLEYCVPLATWRPYHQADFQGDKVRFGAEACIWQNTGEDWHEVELVLSTERQSLGALPPPVPVEYLSTKKRNGEVVVEGRDVEVQAALAASPAHEIPGIDDGGQVFTAPVPGRCSVPSDGNPVRVPLFEFDCAAVMENLLAAEAIPQVVQLTRLQNQSRWPLLAGPVDLIREAGWVGRARLSLVSPGERFQLGWGPQTSLRVSRQVTNGNEEKDDLLGGWVKSRHDTKITLSNLSSVTQQVEVLERIPVSEIKQVEVSADLKAMQPAAQPDENGFLRWNLELGPRSKTVVESAYWKRRRREVVSV